MREILIPFSCASQVPAIWVCTKLLRLHGCNIPITICLVPDLDLGPVAAKMISILAEECHFRTFDSNASSTQVWALIIDYLRQSKSTAVLVLDPDTVPVRDPSYLFDDPGFKATGTMLWPRLAWPVDLSRAFLELEVPFRHCSEIDGAYFLVEPLRHRQVFEDAFSAIASNGVISRLWGNIALSVQIMLYKHGVAVNGIRTPCTPLFASTPEQHLLLGGLCYSDPDGELVFQNRARYPFRLSARTAIGGGLLEPRCESLLLQLRSKISVACRSSGAESRNLVGRYYVDRTRRTKKFERDLPKRDPISIWQAVDFDEWTEIKLCSDGVIECHLDTGATFWDSENRNGLNRISLRGWSGTLIAEFDEVAEGAFAGRWSATGELCRIIRQDVATHCDTVTQLMLQDEAVPHGTVVFQRAEESTWHLINRVDTLSAAVFSLLCACALANTGALVVLHTVHVEWLHRVHNDNLAVATPASIPSIAASDHPGRGDLKSRVVVTDRNSRLYKNNRIGPAEGRSRLLGGNLQPNKPRSVDAAITKKRLDLDRYAVIIPFAEDRTRLWPVQHWLRLIELLRIESLDVVAIGEQPFTSSEIEAFDTSNVLFVAGDSREWTIDVLLGACVVITTHHGLGMLAALHGLRTICLMSEFPAAEYFPKELSLDVVTGDAPCIHCWRDEEKGFLPCCNYNCSALASISPEVIIARLNHGYLRINERSS